MNNQYSDKLNMFGAVIKVCDEDAAATASIPMLQSGIEMLRAGAQKANEMLEEQTQRNTKLLTKTKNGARESVAIAAVKLAKRIISASKRNNLPMLVDQLTVTKSGLMLVTEKEMGIRVKAIAERAGANLALLKDWDVEAKDIEAFRAQIAVFEGYSGQPFSIINTRAAFTESLEMEISKWFDFVRSDLQPTVQSMDESRFGLFMSKFERAANVRTTGSSGQSASEAKDEAVKAADIQNQERQAAPAPQTLAKTAEQSVSEPSRPTTNGASQ